MHFHSTVLLLVLLVQTSCMFSVFALPSKVASSDLGGFTTDIPNPVSSTEWQTVISKGKTFLLGNGFSSMVVELLNANMEKHAQVGLARWPFKHLKAKQAWKAEFVQIRHDGSHCAHLRNYMSKLYLQCNANNCTQTDKPSISFTMNSKGNILPCESDSSIVLDGSGNTLKWAQLSVNQTEFQFQKWFTFSVNPDITWQYQEAQPNKTREFYSALLREAAKGSDAGIWRASNFLIVHLDDRGCHFGLCNQTMPDTFLLHSDGRAFNGGTGMGERNRGIPICNGKCIGEWDVEGDLLQVWINFAHNQYSRFRWVDGKRLCNIENDCIKDALRFKRNGSANIFLSICGDTESFGTLCQNPFNENEPFSIVKS